MEMIRLGVLEIKGKMGTRVSALLQNPLYQSKIALQASPKRGEDLVGLKNCDVLLDFSSPEAVLHALQSGVRCPVLIGSTGWTAAQIKSLEEHVLDQPLFLIPNFSLGVSTVRSILRLLNEKGATRRYAVRIREEHHVHKKDAPSGTALSLARELPQKTPLESVRKGETIGTHEIFLESPFERIEIRHEALSRDLFAAGALESAIALAESAKKFSGKIFTLEDLF